MSEKNTKQNLMTAVSIVVALGAVVYAQMVKMEMAKTTVAINEAKPAVIEVTENNPVVLKIDGKDVTRTEILDNFVKSGSQVPAGANMAQLFPLMQEQYLMSKILLNAAMENGIDENNAEVQMKLMDEKDKAIRAVFLKQLGEKAVSEEDVKNAYDDIIGNQPTITERKARHILLEDQAKANALIVKLNQGRDFAKLAEENSTGPSAPKGGDLGYFVQGEMVPEFAKAAFELEIGKFTQKPVKTQFGYHIILAEDERERAKPTFDQVKGQLANQLRQAAAAEEVQKIRQNADVVMFDFDGNDMAKPEAVEENKGEMPKEEVTETKAETSKETEKPAE